MILIQAQLGLAQILSVGDSITWARRNARLAVGGQRIRCLCPRGSNSNLPRVLWFHQITCPATKEGLLRIIRRHGFLRMTPTVNQLRRPTGVPLSDILRDLTPTLARV